MYSGYLVDHTRYGLTSLVYDSSRIFHMCAYYKYLHLALNNEFLNLQNSCYTNINVQRANVTSSMNWHNDVEPPI